MLPPLALGLYWMEQGSPRWAQSRSTLPLQAMGRIFVGLCQVGAWGCFDEFNRLEERMLSAVSQQVQCIQEALREHSNPNYDKSETAWGLGSGEGLPGSVGGYRDVH